MSLQHRGKVQATCTIGAELTVEGQLRVEGPLIVEGFVEGLVRIDGTLSVGESGVIRGPISAQAVSVAGRIIGDISCLGLVELKAGAHVFGNIVAGRISVSPEAQHQGNVRVINNSLV